MISLPSLGFYRGMATGNAQAGFQYKGWRSFSCRGQDRNAIQEGTKRIESYSQEITNLRSEKSPRTSGEEKVWCWHLPHEEIVKSGTWNTWNTFLFQGRKLVHLWWLKKGPLLSYNVLVSPEHYELCTPKILGLCVELCTPKTSTPILMHWWETES